MTDADIARRLQRAAEALRRKDLSTARALLAELAKVAPEHPDRLQLEGLRLRAEGDDAGAEAAFRRSLAAEPKQPAVLNNLGNLLLRLGRHDEAERAYRGAITIDPQAADSHRNLGLLLLDRGDARGAQTALRTALGRRPEDAGAWTALGRACQDLDQHDNALAAFQAALKVSPGYTNALAGLGHTLRLMDRFDDAIACYDAALRAAPRAFHIRTARASLDVNLGRHAEAEARYRAVLAEDPHNVGAHRELNEMLWQTGRGEEYGASFRAALDGAGADDVLLSAYCEALANAGDQAGVLEALARYDRGERRHPQLLGARARALAATGEHAAAMDLFREALGQEMDDPRLGLDAAQLQIVLGDYRDALATLDGVARLRPDDQLMWACRGTCWRLLGDGRARWLNDIDRFVSTAAIDCPPGHASLEAFLAALGEQLRALHTTTVAPSNQTLRGGTQTFGRLFHRQEPLIRELVGSLTKAVGRHLEQLPVDPAHPLLRRRTGRFRFSGSWSVRLRSEGFHVNHVHPEGWLSSVFYVAVPDDLGQEAGDPAGWLKLGETNLGLGERERIDRLVRPVAGELTLFPSYLWHGTVPFRSAADRLTSPFDVVPD
ncbi:MAG TPA: tetratricopeptide repeat protein [Pseudomonadales bacterium]|nr:tetratricopeptide repeat protein [Pseudomonadales bacterium]